MSETPTKPKKMILGSPASMKKPTPHVLFLIHSTTKLAKIAIVRILLNFHLNVNPQFTWGFEFVHKRALIGKRLDSSKHAFDFNLESLRELGKKMDEYKSWDVDLSTLIDYLNQIPVQCEWNTGQVVPFQSPIKKRVFSKALNIRNYLFIVGSVPEDYHKLAQFSGLDASGLDDSFILEHFGKELGSVEMWAEILSARIATYWVSTNEKSNTNAIFLQWCIAMVLRNRGGGLLNERFYCAMDFEKLWKSQKIESVDTCMLLNQSETLSMPLGKFSKMLSINPDLDLGIESNFPITASFSMDGENITLEKLVPCNYFDKDGFKLSIGPASIESANKFMNLLYKLESSNQWGVISTNSCKYFFRVSCVIGEASVRKVTESELNDLDDANNETIENEITFDPEPLLKGSIPDYVKKVLYHGEVHQFYHNEIQEFTLGIWQLKQASFQVTPLKRNEDIFSARKPVTKALPTIDEVSFSAANMDELSKSFKEIYDSTLFKMKSVKTLLTTFIPKIYAKVGELLKDEESISAILDFYANNLLLSIQELDSKHRTLQKDLEFLVTKCTTSVDEHTQGIARHWFLKTKQKLKSQSKMVLKSGLKELKEQEYSKLTRILLQIVICLECLRITKETGSIFPTKQLVRTKSLKSKKKKAIDMNAEFQLAVNTLCDRLLISSVDEGSSNVWAEFYENIVKLL